MFGARCWGGYKIYEWWQCRHNTTQVVGKEISPLSHSVILYCRGLLEEEEVSAVIAPIFPCQPVFSYFAFSRVIWTLNYTTKILLLYHLFSTLSGEAIGIKQG